MIIFLVLPILVHADFDELELRIPDFFLLGKYPDQVDFDQPSDGRSRSAATASTSRSNSSDSPDIEVRKDFFYYIIQIFFNYYI